MRAYGLIAALTLIAGPAFAQYAPTSYSPWSFGMSLGADVGSSGRFHGSGTSGQLTVPGTGAGTGAGTLEIRDKDFGDIYDEGRRGTLEVRYALSEMAEMFGAVSFARYESEGTAIGCFRSGVTTACNSDLTGQFSDMNQYSLEVGYRQWFGFGLAGGQVKPYFAVRGGLVRTDAIDVLLTTANGSLGVVPFSEESWQAMIGADLGASMAISQNAELGGEIGLRYVTKLEDNDTVLGALGLGRVNDGEGILTVPASVRLNVVF